MEFDKEEARRALGIADRKLSENDYNGAKKFFHKAHRLYPELDGLKQVLMMINVYISAANKINGGGEADWYGILCVDPLADDEAVKKQYKKLALLLHPDKNRFNAAEGAFKLVLEAWCVLSDSSKRIAYDHRRKSNESETGMEKPPNPHKPASDNGNQNARDNGDPRNKPASGKQRPPDPHKPASSNRNRNVKDSANPSAKHGLADSSKQRTGSTFWTMCSICKTQCEYVRERCLNKAIHCPNCGQTFIATEKTPWRSFVKPVNLSSSIQQKQRCSAQKKATTEKTSGASSSYGRKSWVSATATPNTPKASAETPATNKNTRASPSVSATQKTPQANVQHQDRNRNANDTCSEKVSSPGNTTEASFGKPVVNLSSSHQQQQQRNTQNKSTSFSFSFKATCNSRNATNSKRVLEEFQETVACADRILKKPRTQR